MNAEDGHLRRRAHNIIFGADGREPDGVSESLGCAGRPILKFAAGPFEPVIFVA